MNGTERSLRESLPKSLQEEPINFREWFFRIIGYWWLILGCLFLSLISVWVYHRYTLPRYNVSTTIIVSESKNSPDEMLLKELSMFSGSVNINNEIGILKSLSLIQKTIDTLDFEVEYYTVGRIRVAERYVEESPYKVEVIKNETLSGASFMIDLLSDNQFRIYSDDDNPVDGFDEQVLSFPALVEGPGFLFRIVKNSRSNFSMSQGQLKFIVYKPWNLARKYSNQLRISSIDKESSILTISFESSLHAKAADFLNKLVDQYIQRELNQKNLTAERTIEFIDQQLTGIQDTLATIEDRLQTFRSVNRIVNMSEEGISAVQKFKELEQRKASEEIKIEYFDYILEYLQESRNPTSMISPATAGIESPVLDALVQNLNELSAQLIQLELNATEINPQVESLRIQANRVMQGIIENVKNLKESTKIALQDIDDRIKEVEGNLNELPKTERAYVNIQRRFNLSENLFIYLQEKKAEAGIAKASNVPENKRLDPAIVTAQTFPNTKRNYTVGMLLGFILPIGFIFIRTFVSNKIESISDIERRTDLPVLGTIAYSHYKSELVLKEHPRSLPSESFRKVKASLKYLENGSPHQVIMFTSLHSGEGKSFLAMNFACMLAAMNKKVILLGMDLRKPKMYDEFGVKNNKGVSSILIGEESLEKAKYKTAVERLDLLVSGPIPPNPTELLTNEKVTDLFARLRQEYDYIVLDTSPVGLVSDAIELGKHTDIALFIIRQQFTSKHALEYINDIHKKNLLPRIGIILNGVDFKNFKNRMNYGYGYGYGYGFNKGNGYYEE